MEYKLCEKGIQAVELAKRKWIDKLVEISIVQKRDNIGEENIDKSKNLSRLVKCPHLWVKYDFLKNFDYGFNTSSLPP